MRLTRPSQRDGLERRLDQPDRQVGPEARRRGRSAYATSPSTPADPTDAVGPPAPPGLRQSRTSAFLDQRQPRWLRRHPPPEPGGPPRGHSNKRERQNPRSARSVDNFLVRVRAKGTLVRCPVMTGSDRTLPCPGAAGPLLQADADRSTRAVDNFRRRARANGAAVHRPIDNRLSQNPVPRAARSRLQIGADKSQVSSTWGRLSRAGPNGRTLVRCPVMTGSDRTLPCLGAAGPLLQADTDRSTRAVDNFRRRARANGPAVHRQAATGLD
jgi:hypothetical protein